MAEELAQNLILHGGVGRAAHVVLELCLDHAEHGLGIAAWRSLPVRSRMVTARKQ